MTPRERIFDLEERSFRFAKDVRLAIKIFPEPSPTSRTRGNSCVRRAPWERLLACSPSGIFVLEVRRHIA